MNVEKELKRLIIERYGSLLAFSRACDVPNSTINSFLTRGIGTATLSNIFKVCDTLNISADELEANVFAIQLLQDDLNLNNEIPILDWSVNNYALKRRVHFTPKT